MNAVSRLPHAADLLWAFAQLRHVTVATPELLSCLGGEVHLFRSWCLCPQSRAQIRCCATPGESTADSRQLTWDTTPAQVARELSRADSSVARAEIGQDTVRDAATMLVAHEQLGFYPCEQLLAGVQMHVCQLPDTSNT